MLGKLGFPSTEPMRRLVQKVLVSAMTIPLLKGVGGAIRSAHDLMARLSHVHRLNANVLAAVAGAGCR